jgi:hypothetical protein
MKKGGASTLPAPPRLLSLPYSQSEQEAQHSTEEQQPVWAAAAALASPRVITAINSITFNFFMDFLLFNR